jgi:hypothetical protein
MNMERCFFIVVRRLKSSVNAKDLPRDYLSYVTAAATINHFSLSFAFPCSEKCLRAGDEVTVLQAHHGDSTDGAQCVHPSE